MNCFATGVSFNPQDESYTYSTLLFARKILSDYGMKRTFYKFAALVFYMFLVSFSFILFFHSASIVVHFKFMLSFILNYNLNWMNENEGATKKLNLGKNNRIVEKYGWINEWNCKKLFLIILVGIRIRIILQMKLLSGFPWFFSFFFQ